jgi:hypothetical protein
LKIKMNNKIPDRTKIAVLISFDFFNIFVLEALQI